MRRLALMLAALLALSLSGCMGEPTESEKDAARQKGEQLMRAWLERALPGAELVSAEPYVFHNLGVAPYELTDAVSGTFRYDGVERAFVLDTADGTVYFEQSDETVDRLRELCASYAAEALGLGGEYTVSAGRGAYFDIGMGTERQNLLPADFVLSGGTLESLVRSPKERPAITVSLTYRVPDEFDVSRITLAESRRAMEEYGLLFRGLSVKDGSEETTLEIDGAAYRRMDFGEAPDFRVWMPVYEREERLNGKTGKTETTIAERDVPRDLAVERGTDGFYKVSFPNGYFHALAYAYEGSEMLRHTYYYISDNGKTVELAWRETERGWQLGGDDSYLSETHPFTELN